MRKTFTLKIWLIPVCILFTYAGFSQNLQPWQIEHAQLNPTYFAAENSKPNPTAFDNMIGASLGKEIGGAFHDGFNAAGVINSARSFHLMEADFGDAYYPRERVLNTIDCDCGDIFSFSCKQKKDKKCLDHNPSGNEFGFYEYKVRYCAWKNKDHFKMREIYAAIEAQIPIKDSYCREYSNGVCIRRDTNPCLIKDGRDTLPGRKFPDKWYTAEEWGGDAASIQQHAYNYIYPFVATFCPADTSKKCVIDVLEIGNEPWGNFTPGREGYHAILRAAVQAMKKVYGVDKSNWRMKLSTAAFDARFACHNAPKQYVQEMIPDEEEIKHYIDYLNVHNYPFIKTPCGVEVKNLKLAYTPESPNGGFLSLKNMDEWRRRNGMEHARINITEFGWNSDKEECNYGVGQANQAAYLMRANLIAARFSLHKVFNYQLKDQLKHIQDGQLVSPESPLYCTTGLIDRDGNKKLSFYATQTMVQKLAGKHFIKAIEENYTQEGDVFAFLLGDYDEATQKAKPTHLVAWRADNLGVSETMLYPERDSEKGNSLTTIQLPSTNMKIAAQADYFYLGWEDGKPQKIGNQVVHQNGITDHQVKVDLSGLPIVIPINAGTCYYDKNGQLVACDYDYDSTPPDNTQENGIQLTCGDVEINYGSNWIKWTGENGVNYPKVELINITNWQYKAVDQCNENCGNTKTYTNLPEGDYILKIFNPNWTLGCELKYDTRIHLSGSDEMVATNPCDGLGGDMDNDGICSQDDCDDNNPDFPKIAGTTCNDGNPNTENDVIGSDGCTCAGEQIEEETNGNEPNSFNLLTCGEVNISYGNGQISFKGKTGKSYPFKIQIKQPPYTQASCHNCGDSKVFSDLAVGTYEVWINYQSCGIIELVATDENSTEEGCEDSDNDGFCNQEDCAPNDPLFPQPIGTNCDDGNSQTENDVILSDGCTCQGEIIQHNEEGETTTLSCGEINIKYGNGQIEMTGLSTKSYTFSINDEQKGWKQVFSCTYNCGYTQKAIYLSPSDYLVRAYHNNNEICSANIKLTNNLNSNALSRDVLELTTSVLQQTIQLEWVAGGINETENFILEKSMDGINFKPIQEINTPTDYHFKLVDERPDYGTNHYRVKQQFTSGTFRYSTISAEKYFVDENAINLFPNPARTEINLSIGHFANLQGTIHIFNRIGNEVLTRKLDASQQSLNFDVSNFQNGLYYLMIESENRKTITRRFVVENGK